MKLGIEYLSLPKDGENKCGDAVIVRRIEKGALIGVIDALGHGDHAAVVAEAAVECLTSVPLDRGVRVIVEMLHQHLRGSRGAAAMLCLIHQSRIEGCGVGNVELRSAKSNIPVVLSPGILGGAINRMRIFEAQLTVGNRFVIFSDGLSSRIDLEACRSLSATATCQAFMNRYRRHYDDATVLVTDIEA